MYIYMYNIYIYTYNIYIYMYNIYIYTRIIYIYIYLFIYIPRASKTLKKIRSSQKDMRIKTFLKNNTCFVLCCFSQVCPNRVDPDPYQISTSTHVATSYWQFPKIEPTIAGSRQTMLIIRAIVSLLGSHLKSLLLKFVHIHSDSLTTSSPAEGTVRSLGGSCDRWRMHTFCLIMFASVSMVCSVWLISGADCLL